MRLAIRPSRKTSAWSLNSGSSRGLLGLIAVAMPSTRTGFRHCHDITNSGRPGPQDTHITAFKLAAHAHGNMISASVMLNHGNVSTESETCCIPKLAEAKSSTISNMSGLL